MMKAVKLLDSKHVFNDGAIQQLVIWELSEPVRGSQHAYKYRLYYGKDGARIVGYDNERGKGDHKHYYATETPYTFTTPEQVWRDFVTDIMQERGKP